MLIFVFHCEKL